MQEAVARRPSKRARAVGEQRHRDRRGQGEPGPGRKAAEIAGAHEADRKAGLAAGGTGQELGEADEVGIGAFVEPGAPDNEFVAEIAKMRDRPAERGEAEPEKDAQDFERRAGRRTHGADALPSFTAMQL